MQHRLLEVLLNLEKLYPRMEEVNTFVKSLLADAPATAAVVTHSSNMPSESKHWSCHMFLIKSCQVD